MIEKPQICGIISEFNPFHLGHESLIQQTRANGASHIVCVMSGNYVQRGEPAIFSKWARAEMALKCGADLIVELPLPWAVSGAEKFALAGVSLLHAMGCISTIAFGSECGKVDELMNAAKAILSPEINGVIQQELKTGLTFAKARQNAVMRLYGETASNLLMSPNNILAIEYCKALLNLQSSIIPFTVKRSGAKHDDNKAPGQNGFASSSQIRSMLANGNYHFKCWMPILAAEIANRELNSGLAPTSFQKLELAVLSKLRTMTISDFAMLPDISEGLENRIYQAVRTAVSIEDLYNKIKTKRYTHARIRRIILSAFLNVQKKDSSLPPAYLKIIGMNHSGMEILKIAKNTTSIPIVTNLSDIFTLDSNTQSVLELEHIGSDLFALSQPNVQPCGTERTKKIVIIQ